MATVPHPVPSRTAHAIAALYGVADDTVVAWQRFCAQTAEALRQHHDAERLSKALALAQGGGVELAEDGGAVVTSGTKRYPVQPDGRCDCPDFAHRRTPCKHTLAVLIHTRAQALAAPSPSPAPVAAAAPAAAPAEDPARWQMTPKTAARWDVHEAPASACVKFRVGSLELLYTFRGQTDAEVLPRLRDTLPVVQALLTASAAPAEPPAALAAEAAPAPSAPTAPTPGGQADREALLQAALAALHAQVQERTGGRAQGHTAPPEASDQATGVCSRHQVPMELHRDPTTGDTWRSHYDTATGRYCKGARQPRPTGTRR